LIAGDVKSARCRRASMREKLLLLESLERHHYGRVGFNGPQYQRDVLATALAGSYLP